MCVRRDLGPRCGVCPPCTLRPRRDVPIRAVCPARIVSRSSLGHCRVEIGGRQRFARAISASPSASCTAGATTPASRHDVVIHQRPLIHRRLNQRLANKQVRASAGAIAP